MPSDVAEADRLHHEVSCRYLRIPSVSLHHRALYENILVKDPHARTKVVVVVQNQTLPETPLDEQGVTERLGHPAWMLMAYLDGEETHLEEIGEKMGDLDVSRILSDLDSQANLA